MNTEIKARWVAALRSGEFEQGKEYLNRDGRMCCLGVLCELAVQDGVISKVGEGELPYLPYVDYGQGDEETLPPEVAAWAGLTGNGSQNPVIDPAGITGLAWLNTERNPSLAELNDGGTPFGKIADVIDAQL